MSPLTNPLYSLYWKMNTSLTVFKAETNLVVFRTLQIGRVLKVFTEIFLKQKQKRFFRWYCATSHQTQVYKSFCWLHVQMTWCQKVLATSWPVCIHTYTKYGRNTELLQYNFCNDYISW